MDKPFTPTAPTYLVTNTATYISAQVTGNTLRILNLAAAVQGFAYAPGPNPNLTYTAPTAAAQSATVQMASGASEKFSGLIGAQGVTLCASSSTGFNVTPGDGL